MAQNKGLKQKLGDVLKHGHYAPDEQRVVAALLVIVDSKSVSLCPTTLPDYENVIIGGLVGLPEGDEKSPEHAAQELVVSAGDFLNWKLSKMSTFDHDKSQAVVLESDGKGGLVESVLKNIMVTPDTKGNGTVH